MYYLTNSSSCWNINYINQPTNNNTDDDKKWTILLRQECVRSKEFVIKSQTTMNYTAAQIKNHQHYRTEKKMWIINELKSMFYMSFNKVNKLCVCVDNFTFGSSSCYWFGYDVSMDDGVGQASCDRIFSNRPKLSLKVLLVFRFINTLL